MKPVFATLIVSTAIFMYGCSSGRDAETVTIKSGMSFPDVEARLARLGAENVVLAMEPPRDSEGSYLELANFEVAENTIISVVFDKSESATIVSMSICDHTQKRKDQQAWKPIESYTMHSR